MDVVGGVDLEALVGGDGRGDVGEEGGEGWEGAGAEVGACLSYVLVADRCRSECGFHT